MIVRNIMNKTIYSIEHTKTVRESLKMMYQLGIGRLFVFDKQNNPIGVISYKDILVLLGSDETSINIDTVKVSDIMTDMVTTIDASESIQNAANLILRADISGLLVTENGENIGVITKTDICRIVSMSDIKLS
ncbi:MAG: CBS domain-containing protein [Methanosphaera stadtmanae]|nr:CBS domain-containing protein [Methanosphaera stadtmanae]